METFVKKVVRKPQADGGASKIDMDQGGYMIPSRFGMRGTENLGGGNSVGFWLEALILPNNGGPRGISFTRRSTISFINPQYGERRLGRDYTAAFWNISSFSPFGTVGRGRQQQSRPGLAHRHGRGQHAVAREQEIEGAGYAGDRPGYREGGCDIAGAYGRIDVGSRDYRHATLGSSNDFKVVKVFANYLRQTLGQPGRHATGFQVGMSHSF
ncbi:porin [Bordetella hinzii]|uniref:porin n=1 Tax=Bordetella hinzii TaxID=103855 RepID=UPI001F0F977B|nr:porin [Bordetella hinzii]